MSLSRSSIQPSRRARVVSRQSSGHDAAASGRAFRLPLPRGRETYPHFAHELLRSPGDCERTITSGFAFVKDLFGGTGWLAQQPVDINDENVREFSMPAQVASRRTLPLARLPTHERWRRGSLMTKQKGRAMETRKIETRNGRIAAHEFGRAGAAGRAHPWQFLVVARLFETARRAARRAFPVGRDRSARPRSLGRREGPRFIFDEGPGADAVARRSTPRACRRPASSAGASAAISRWSSRPICRGRAESSFSARRRSPTRRRWKLAFLPHPAMGAGSAETLDRAQAEAYVAAFFRPGFGDVSPFFVEDALARRRARA